MRALVPLLRAAPSPFLPLLCRTTRCTARSIARRREFEFFEFRPSNSACLSTTALEPATFSVSAAMASACSAMTASRFAISASRFAISASRFASSAR